MLLPALVACLLVILDIHAYESVQPGRARIDPGATQRFITELHGDSPISPPDLRIRYTATNATIVGIEPRDPRWNCSFSGGTGECTGNGMDPYCQCSQAIDVILRANPDRNGTEAKLEMEAISSVPKDPYDLPGTATLQTYRVFTVTNTADAGPGSLRDAMTQAGASCTPGPCKILFEIAEAVPPEGWFTIVPATELPVITAQRIALDGTTQTRFSGDTNPRGPEVAIDGRFALRGLELRAPCEAIVEGLAIGNFIGGDGLGVQATARDCPHGEPDRRLVAGNYIGVDPTGTAAWPNQRGLNIEGHLEVRDNVISRNKWSAIWLWRGTARITSNRIEDNGKSGIVLGPESEHAWVHQNVINRQVEMGLAIAPDAKLYNIRENSMRDNGGLGIDIGIDGVSRFREDDEYPAPSNAPTLLSAVYDAAENRTVVTLVLDSRPFGPYISNVIFDLYANRGPDGDGEQHVGSRYAFDTDAEGRYHIDLFGDYRGQWINATSTRTHTNWAKPPDDKRVAPLSYSGEGSSTSELSNAVPVS
jgi:Right handed beta helix region